MYYRFRVSKSTAREYLKKKSGNNRFNVKEREADVYLMIPYE